MRHDKLETNILVTPVNRTKSGEPGGVSPRTPAFHAKHPGADAARLTTLGRCSRRTGKRVGWAWPTSDSVVGGAYPTHAHRPKRTGGSAHPTGRLTRRGFTLVEMLISVALVLLMMSLFAQIFQMAGASVSKQRGLMENDQRARTLQTIIKGDLDKRTFRKVLPFTINEGDDSGPEIDFAKRRGYFYISENSPTNQLDDVLQYTVQSSIVVYNKDESQYFGRALPLIPKQKPPASDTWRADNPQEQINYFHANFNQPDTDDAQLNVNATATSKVSEVSYFIRNGNLYRRQLLIREPLPIADSDQPEERVHFDFTADTSTFNTTPLNFFDPNLGTLPNAAYPLRTESATTFWNDFDFSAYLTYASAAPNNIYVLTHDGTATVTGAKFLGISCLNNDGTSDVQIGKPMFRFGHQPRVSSAVVGTVALSEIGQPKEYTNTTSTAEFIGRYTLEECSHSSFTYPQAQSIHPLRLSTDLGALDANKVVNGLDGGTRRGEDLLMSNVHSFDVQVWDDAANGGLGAFVDIGGTGASDYAMSNNNHANPSGGGSPFLYGPTTTATSNRIFDTWHPEMALDNPASSGNEIQAPPPFRPYKYYPVTGGGSYVAYEEWQPNTGATAAPRYNLGSRVFPPAASRPYGNPFYYACVGVNDTDMDGDIEHSPTSISWPRIEGLRVVDGEVTWEAVENRKPLKAIKLEIRFVDTSTQQMRQLTIVQSLVD